MQNIQHILAPYRAKIENALLSSLKGYESPSKLKKACEYALMGEAKRFRPALVLMIANALGNNQEALEAALAVEFFHTASLIADDLPCMDNEDQRRSQLSAHKQFGEATALLSSYALISEGYLLLAKNSEKIGKPELCQMAVENVSVNTGLKGAAGGQFLDVFPEDFTENFLREVILKKTVTLFEISFVLGWLYGGGDPSLLDRIKGLAYHFGMAFQIVDDLEDAEEDRMNDRKMNFVSFFGRAAAEKMFEKEIFEFKEILKTLPLNSTELLALSQLLENKKELLK